jgi:hypothetical protein
METEDEGDEEDNVEPVRIAGRKRPREMPPAVEPNSSAVERESFLWPSLPPSVIASFSPPGSGTFLLDPHSVAANTDEARQRRQIARIKLAFLLRAPPALLLATCSPCACISLANAAAQCMSSESVDYKAAIAAAWNLIPPQWGADLAKLDYLRARRESMRQTVATAAKSVPARAGVPAAVVAPAEMLTQNWQALQVERGRT